MPDMKFSIGVTIDGVQHLFPITRDEFEMVASAEATELLGPDEEDTGPDPNARLFTLADLIALRAETQGSTK